MLNASTHVRISYHILLPFRFENNLERKVLKRAVVIARGKSFGPEDLAFNGKIDSVRWDGRDGFVDDKVFNRNGLMRMMHCNKMDKKNWLEPIDFLSEDFFGFAYNADEDHIFATWPVDRRGQLDKSLLTGDKSMTYPFLPRNKLQDRYEPVVLPLTGGARPTHVCRMIDQGLGPKKVIELNGMWKPY